MNKCMTLAVVAGLTTIVAAGPAETFSLTINPEKTLIAPSGTTTVRLDIFGDSSFGTHLLGGGFNLTGSGTTQYISDIRWENAGWSFINQQGAYDGNGSYNDVIFGQLVVFTDQFDFLPGEESLLGSRIGTFEVDLTENFRGTIRFDLTTHPELNRFALQTMDIDEAFRTTDSLNSNEGALTLGHAEIIDFPAPSGVALLGFGGLAVSRRRR